MAAAMTTRGTALLLAAVTVAALVYPAMAATLKPGFTETIIASGLASPTAMAFAPDGRLFVCQQTGQLRVIENNQLLPTPFVSLTVNSTGERGLLGVAFDPNFTSNQFVYVYYTATSPTIHNRVSRFTANGNVAVAGSEVALLDLPTLVGHQPQRRRDALRPRRQALHRRWRKRGWLELPDTGQPPRQDPAHQQQRLDPDRQPVLQPDHRRQPRDLGAWACATRSRSRSIRRRAGCSSTTSGRTRGKRSTTGPRAPTTGGRRRKAPTSNPSFVTPVYRYAPRRRAAFQGCAITGGAFYAGLPAQFPAEYVGDYFFADYCTGWINQLDDSGANPVVTTFASGISSPVDLAVGP